MLDVKTVIMVCRPTILSDVFRVSATDIRPVARRLRTTLSTSFSQISLQVRAVILLR